MVYPLMVLTYFLYCIVEGWLALNSPDQVMVWLYVPLNVWCMINAIAGWNLERSKDEF